MPSEEAERTERGRRRLAERLRQLRVNAGLSQHEIAAALGVSQPKVSKIERAAQSVPIPDIRAWLRTTDASQEEADELTFLAERLLIHAPSWQDEFTEGMAGKQRQVNEIEKGAAHLRVFHNEVVPGLLQTAEYARGLFGLIDEYGAGDVEAAVSARLARQQVLYNQRKRFEFLVSEAALWWRPGTRQMLAEQMTHIANVSELPNVWVGVIPLDSEAVAPHQSFVIYDDDLVVVETTTREPTMRDPEEIAFHIRLFERLKTSAVSGEAAHLILEGMREKLLATG